MIGQEISLARAFSNLIENAIKYNYQMAKNGSQVFVGTMKEKVCKSNY